MTKGYLRLGVNVDHVATLRNARGGVHPCPIRAAQTAEKAGADGITAHLREDRRHIRDRDMERLKAEVSLPLNFEMAPTDEMLKIALQIQPHAVCLVPERREELTTEGGLAVAENKRKLQRIIDPLLTHGIRVSLFIDPTPHQIEAAAALAVPCVELHTGDYAESPGFETLTALQNTALAAHQAGLEVHAGHGLNFDNVRPVAAIPQLKELNIGHFLIGEALFSGLDNAIRHMRHCMEKGRT